MLELGDYCIKVVRNTWNLTSTKLALGERKKIASYSCFRVSYDAVFGNHFPRGWFFPVSALLRVSSEATRRVYTRSTSKITTTLWFLRIRLRTITECPWGYQSSFGHEIAMVGFTSGSLVVLELGTVVLQMSRHFQNSNRPRLRVV